MRTPGQVVVAVDNTFRIVPAIDKALVTTNQTKVYTLVGERRVPKPAKILRT